MTLQESGRANLYGFPSVIDCETREGEIARRNVLFGLWAGRRMGLAGEDLETYAWSVHFADCERPGHEDVIAKVSGDLARCGVSLDDRKLRERLREMRLRACLDLAQDWEHPGVAPPAATPTAC